MRTFLGTLFLRIGVAFSLLYPAIMSFVNPDKWAGGLPAILTQLVAVKTLIIIFAGYELLFGIIILIKPDPGWLAGIVSITFIALAIMNYQNFDSVYQNLTVAFASLALAFLGKIRG